MRPRNRVALITGAASGGLGRAFAARLAKDGDAIVIVDLDDASETLACIKEVGGRGFGFVCDLSDQDAVADMASKVTRDCGVVDVLLNVAGIYPQAPFLDTSLDMWRRVFEVNLTSMFLTCQAFLPAMVAQDYGRIVNISSGTVFVPSSGYSAYIASKAGVIGLTRALATEFGAHGITVNAVTPGLIRTPTSEMLIEADRFPIVASGQPIPRVGLPSDVVGAVAFLASDNAAFITAQNLVVDGGAIRL
jgi:3-oxoacyl-[acyl-carrier protein] reductase/(S)-1-phenylethanol dehydrogenase